MDDSLSLLTCVSAGLSFSVPSALVEKKKSVALTQ